MRVLLAMLAVAALCGGCAKTQLITEPGARIYVDGALAGRGRAEIRRNGMPSTVLIEVKTDDGRRKEVVLQRKFTLATAGIGLITYGIGLLTCWQHPAGVHINLPKRSEGGWDGADDPWADPPPDDPWMDGAHASNHPKSNEYAKKR